MSARSEDAKPNDVDRQGVERLSHRDNPRFRASDATTARRRELELRRIEAALLRIDRDEYGYCTSCGEQVALTRLERDPATALCVDCASRAT